MSYLLTHFWPGGSDEQYRATLGEVDLMGVVLYNRKPGSTGRSVRGVKCVGAVVTY
jgi:hypothetical protein